MTRRRTSCSHVDFLKNPKKVHDTAALRKACCSWATGYRQYRGGAVGGEAKFPLRLAARVRLDVVGVGAARSPTCSPSRGQSPCIVFITSRRARQVRSSPMSATRTRNAQPAPAEMDLFDARKGVKHGGDPPAEVLDPALLRPVLSIACLSTARRAGTRGHSAHPLRTDAGPPRRLKVIARDGGLRGTGFCDSSRFGAARRAQGQDRVREGRRGRIDRLIAGP